MAYEEQIFFQLLYLLFVNCLVYPPQEFKSAGLTAERLFSALLRYPPEELQFTQHHIRRTSVNILLHSCIPIIYLILYDYQFHGYPTNALRSLVWSVSLWISVGLPIVAALVLGYWWKFDAHPLINTMRKYCNQEQSWCQVSANINEEFRRPEKTVCTISTVVRVIATENWVINTNPYAVKIAHQSDTALILVKSDTHLISQDDSDSIQFVNILVKPTRPGVKSFHIRLNALLFADLQDRINRPITILSGVNFNRSILERFVEVFKEQVAVNGVYETNQELDSCFACMLATPDIKLQKRCMDVDEQGAPLPEASRCGSCFCRPMWCADCMAKWFASKQSEHAKEVWLHQKCSCPMCRAQFCMLDVCRVQQI